MRQLILVALLLAPGCAEEDEPCRADRCLPLSDFSLPVTGIDRGDTTTWFLELTERDAPDPLILRLECTTDSAVDSCVKSFTMPDLPRLPTAVASLTKADETVGASRGTWRVSEVTASTDNMSYRVSGRVDSLGFTFEDEEIEVREGTFDILSSP